MVQLHIPTKQLQPSSVSIDVHKIPLDIRIFSTARQQRQKHSFPGSLPLVAPCVKNFHSQA